MSNYSEIYCVVSTTQYLSKMSKIKNEKNDRSCPLITKIFTQNNNDTSILWKKNVNDYSIWEKDAIIVSMLLVTHILAHVHLLRVPLGTLMAGRRTGPGGSAVATATGFTHKNTFDTHWC